MVTSPSLRVRSSLTNINPLILPLQPPQLTLHLYLFLNLPSLLPILLTSPLLLPYNHYNSHYHPYYCNYIHPPATFHCPAPGCFFSTSTLPKHLNKEQFINGISSIPDKLLHLTTYLNALFVFVSIPPPPSHLIPVEIVLSSTLQKCCTLA
jgi:hypothetical protein